MFGAIHFSQIYFSGFPTLSTPQFPLPPINLGVPSIAVSDPQAGHAESSLVTEEAGSGNFRLV